MKKKKKVASTAKLKAVKGDQQEKDVADFTKIMDEAIAAGKEKRTAILNNGPFGFVIVKGDVWLLHALDRKGLQVAKAGKPVNAKRVVISKEGIAINYTHSVAFSIGYEIKPASEQDDGIHQMISVYFNDKEGGRQFNIPEFAFKRILATAVLMRNKNLELSYGEAEAG